MIRRYSEARTEVRENMRGGDGSVRIRHLLEKDDFAVSVRLCAELVIPPGAGIGPHTHEHEDEVYVVNSGTGVLDEGNDETPVSKGDAVLTGRGGTHAIRNTGDEDLVLTAFIVCYAAQADAHTPG